MSVLTIINLFLIPSLITTLILGAILNHKSIETNKYQYTLMTTFIYWAAIFFYVYIKYFIDIKAGERLTISFVSDVCSTQVLLLGSFCFVSLISYPVVILEAKYLKYKSWWKRLKPTTISIASYFIVDIVAGVDPFIKYASLSEFASNIASVSVISRLCLIVTLIYIWGSEIVRVWRLVPYYNQYVKDNFADSQCNVEWIRTLLIYISCLMCAYCVMLFFSSPIINLLYLLTVLTTFGYMIKMSLLYRTSEGIETLDIFRDPQNPKGYIVVKTGVSETESTSDNLVDATQDTTSIITPSDEILEGALTQINSWMERESPYVSTHFSINDILSEFPQYTRFDLTAIFRQTGETFQSYVRRYRIRKACEIMNDQDTTAYNQKIYALVGFSHYSSFSRSFVSMLNVSPSNFAKLSSENKQTLIEKLSESTNCDTIS